MESEKVCQTGLDEEAELHWKTDQAAALQPCQGIKHTFARIARECPDVKFLSLNVSTRIWQQQQALCSCVMFDRGRPLHLLCQTCQHAQLRHLSSICYLFQLYPNTGHAAFVNPRDPLDRATAIAYSACQGKRLLSFWSLRVCMLIAV